MNTSGNTKSNRLLESGAAPKMDFCQSPIGEANSHNWNARILEEVKAVELALAEEIAARGWTEETP